MPEKQIHPNEKRAFLLVLILLAVSQIGESIYLPALPSIYAELGGSEAATKAMVGVFLTSYGAVQFFYGPCSDRFGRRYVVLGSICVFVFGAFLAAVSNGIKDLLFSVMIMGAGIGSGGLMCRTVAKDLFSETAQLHKAYATVGATLVLVPLIAPLLGAYCFVLFGWRAIFWSVFSLGILILGIMWKFFPETHFNLDPYGLNWSHLKRKYGLIFKTPAFWGNTLCVSISCVALWGYETIAPFLLQQQLGLTEIQYSWSVLFPIIGFFLGSLWSRRLSQVCHSDKVTLLGVHWSMVASLLLMLGYWFFGLSLWTFLVPIFLYMFGSGILFASTTAGALAPFPAMAGVAGASLGGILNALSGLGGICAASLPDQNQLPLGIFMTICTILSYIAFWKGIGFHQIKARTTERRSELNTK